jgi:hypothetical protein
LKSRYIQERVSAEASNENEKQPLLTSWVNNAKILAEVIYYDKELERLVQALGARGGCGG